MELWDPDDDGDRNEPLLGLPSNADWVLYAPFYWDGARPDPLAYQLSRDIDRYAPRTRFVEVFLTARDRPLRAGDYQGVYVLTEEIERDETGSTSSDSIRMTSTPSGSPGATSSSAIEREETSRSGPVMRMVSSTSASPSSWWIPRARTWRTPAGLPRRNSSSPAGPSGRGFPRRPSLRHPDGSHRPPHHQYLLQEPRRMRFSGYLRTGEKIHAGPVWDFDPTAGSSTAVRRTRCTGMRRTSPVIRPTCSICWWRTAFEDPVFRARYWARMESLLEDELSLDNTLAHIDAMASELDEAGERNTERWGVPEFEGEVEALRDWFRARHGWMLDCVQSSADPRTCAG